MQEYTVIRRQQNKNLQSSLLRSPLYPSLLLQKIIPLRVAVGFLIHQWAFHPCPYMNYSHCWMDKQEHAIQKRQLVHSASLFQVIGLVQINKPVKEKKKNENAAIVW